jgi:hypothetical protein
MAAHKGPASLRPRCTRGGSSVAAIPVYHQLQETEQFMEFYVNIRERDINKINKTILLAIIFFT